MSGSLLDFVAGFLLDSVLVFLTGRSLFFSHPADAGGRSESRAIT